MPAARRHAAVCVLLAATFGFYSPYATNRLVSGNADGDGATYLIVLADACAQARQGVFPVYVGQSALRFNGGLYPQAQAPLLTLVAPALDLVTARSLSATTLMNLVVLLAALAGALAMYAVLLRLAPASPWAAAGLAFAYAACPGVMGVLVRLDMLTSFLTLPLLPWIWHALLRAWEGHEARAGVTLGLALALLWAAHPPVALWASATATFVGMAGLALHRRGLRAGLIAGAVFAVAFAWPLVTLMELTGGRAAGVGLGTAGGGLPPETVARTLVSVRGDFPGALLPVGWVRGHPFSGWPRPAAAAPLVPRAWSEGAVLPYLQLGWTLWAALAAGAWGVLARRDRRLAALSSGALVLLAFLLPLPWLTPRLWGLLPGVFNVTKWWPMQRLYLVLASLAAPIGALAWSALQARRPRARVFVAALLAAWSAHEAAKFTALARGQRVRGPEAARLENVRLHAKDLQSAAPRLFPEFTDPLLHWRVVDARGHARADNFDVVRAACARALPIAPPTHDEGAAPARLTLAPRRRTLLCAHDAPAGLLEAYASDFYRHRMIAPPSGDAALPLFTTRETPQTVHVRLVDPTGRPAAIDAGRLRVATYEPRELPLRVLSWVPLRVAVDGLADVDDATGAPLWLETPRQYVAGYRAWVDGREVPPQRSAAGLVAVALPLGSHTVELAYAGPPAARKVFPLSVAAWLLAGAWLARGCRRRGGIG